MKFIYPAVFKKTEDGRYKGTFPDLEGCFGEGDTLDEAIESANAAAFDWISVELSEEVPELPEDIPSEADLYLPHGPSAYCSNVYHMDYTGKTNDTLPDSRKNHLDHSSIQHMDSHEKPVDPLLLSAAPVQLHIF